MMGHLPSLRAWKGYNQGKDITADRIQPRLLHCWQDPNKITLLTGSKQDY